MVFIPFGEFAPDQAVLGNAGISDMENVVPLTKRSYGPFAELLPVTNALTAECQGAIAVRDSEGVNHIFAGDATKLYKLNADGVTWDDVSRASGYSTPADGRWYFVQIGDRIVATNYADEIQTYVLGTSALFANLSSSAPKARYLAVIKGALVVADTWDATDGYKQNRVWWADLTDPTNWPTPGTAAAAAAQSDFQDIAFGGQITGLIGGCGDRHGVVFLQNAIVTMDYVGGGIIFSFQDAERGRGCAVPTSLINVGTFAGYISEEGFNLFDGARSIPIGAGRVDRFFWDNVSQTALVRICAGADAKKKLICWAWTHSSDGVDLPNRLLVYSWELDRWSHIRNPANTGPIEFLFTAYSTGYTLEGLDSVSGSIDSLPFSLDSSAWVGGRPRLAAFSDLHKFGFFDGSNRPVYIQTGEWSGQNGRRVFCRGVRAVGDFGSSDCTLQLIYRNTQSGSVSQTANVTPSSTNEIAPFRVSARYMKVELEISSGATWNHVQGLDVDYIEEGQR